jgi:hypothetical protein
LAAVSAESDLAFGARLGLAAAALAADAARGLRLDPGFAGLLFFSLSSFFDGLMIGLLGTLFPSERRGQSARCFVKAGALATIRPWISRPGAGPGQLATR